MEPARSLGLERSKAMGWTSHPVDPEGWGMDESTMDAEMVRRRELRDRNVHDVVGLLERRTDLRGIYPMADLVADNFAWMV